MTTYFKKAVWLLHELSATAPGGKFTGTELSWTNWEKTVSCCQKAIRDWDKSTNSEGGQTKHVKARSSSVLGGLIQKGLKEVGAWFSDDTRNSHDLSHLMYKITPTSVAADTSALKNCYILPAICFFIFSPKSHQPSSGQDSKAVSADKSSW